MRRLIHLFLVLFVMAGIAAAQNREIKGTLRYEDRKWGFAGGMGQTGAFGAWRPIRGVEVRIRVTPSGVERVVTTSSTGGFTTLVPASQAGIGSQVEVKFKASNYAADVYLDLDGDDEKLEWTRTGNVTTSSGAIVVSANVTVAQVAAHFNIADDVLRGRIYADGRRSDTDDIACAEIQYPDDTWNHYEGTLSNNISISGPTIMGEGGWSGGDWGYNDETILHEYGHALTDDISDDDAQYETQHFGHIGYGYDFAWSEGFPTYFANAVRLKNATLWTGQAGWWGFDGIEGIPLIPGTTMTAALDSENMTSSCLYDIADGVNMATESFDRMNAFDATVFQVFDREMDEGEDLDGDEIPRNILGFHDAFVRRYDAPVVHAKLDRIMAAHGLCPHRLTDYRVTAVSAATMSAVIDQWVPVTFTVSRTRSDYGNTTATVRLRLSRFTSTGLETWPLGDFNVTLPAYPTTFGSNTVQATRTVSVRMPWQLSTGTYSLSAKVDPNDDRLEQNESNNSRARGGFYLDNPMGDFNPGYAGQDGSNDTESNDSSDVH